MDLQKLIARNIQSARGEMSRQELADAAGVTYKTIYDIEEERRNPSLDVLVQIAKALNVTAADLLREDKATAPVIKLKPSQVLSKYLRIPDDIVEGVQPFDLDDKFWDEIRVVVEFGQKRKKKKNGNSNHSESV